MQTTCAKMCAFCAASQVGSREASIAELAQTWSSLAAQTEAYEAIVCKFIARGGKTTSNEP